MMIGFGNVEVAYRANIERFIADVVNKVFSMTKPYEFITDAEQLQIQETIKQLELLEGGKYDTADKAIPRPERYSKFHFSIAYSGRDVFIGVSYRHINSQHALSPDGMALMQLREVYWHSNTR